MTYARQRGVLLAQNAWIPYKRIISGKPDYTQLKSWIMVLDQDDKGNVFTNIGTFNSADLDFKEG